MASINVSTDEMDHPKWDVSHLDESHTPIEAQIYTQGVIKNQLQVAWRE